MNFQKKEQEVKANNIPFKCPYNNFSCDKYNFMLTSLNCEKCKHYNNGIRVKDKNFCKWIKKIRINVIGLFRKS